MLPPRRLPVWRRRLPLGLVVLLLLTGCSVGRLGRSAAPPPESRQSPAAPHLQYLDMAEKLVADPGDPGKQMLDVTIHVQAAAATEGAIALVMIVDPGSAAPWPRPAYAGGSAQSALQQVKVGAGPGELKGAFPLRARQNGKVQPDVYNIQSGGFYDVLVYGGGLPSSPKDTPLAAFQTNRLYALTDFGGPPATPTPVPTATPAGTPLVQPTPQPTATFAPTSTPEATATPLPPPFTVGLLKLLVTPQLTGSVGAVTAGSGTTVTAPAGQTYVVGIFVVRRDLPTSSVDPLPVKLSAGSAGPWTPDNTHIVADTGNLELVVPPYGSISIVYDPRGQQEHDRQVAAQVWLVPAGAATDPAALRFDGQPAAAFPAAAVTWVDPGFPYQLKMPIRLNPLAYVQVMEVQSVAAAAGSPVAGTATPVPGSALEATLAITGSTAAPLTLRLQLVVEGANALRTKADCPTQLYAKLVLGSPQLFKCRVPVPYGGVAGAHLGVTGIVNGDAITTQWMALPG